MFLELSILLAVTATVAFVIRLLRQPLVVAYLLAGVIAGPIALNLLADNGEFYRAFADLGVVLLLFVVGLNLNVRHLRVIGRGAVAGGIGQFVFTAIVGFLLLLLIPMPLPERAYLAIAVTFSSTIVIVKLLSDNGDTDRLYGRNVIGLMVVQDLIALVLLLGLAVIGSTETTGNIMDVAWRAALLVIGIAALVRFLLPKVLDMVAASPEHLFLTTVAWCIGIASAIAWAGFSLELGALVAGLTLATSPYQPEIASRIRPLRDFFLVLFFLILGATLQFSGSASALITGALLSAFILIGNPIILYAIYRWLGFTRRNSFLAGVTAAQVSEFGFVLLLTGQRLGHVGGDALAAFTFAALTTIIGSTYLVTYNRQCYRFVQPLLAKFGTDHRQPERERETYDAWVFGYHRIGWKVTEALRESDVRFAVVDDDPQATARIRERGISEYFGDASDEEFLSSLPLSDARLIVSTIPDIDTSLVLLRHLRERLRAKTRIIVTADHVRALDPLYAAGADFVLLPHLLGGVWISNVLTEKPWTATVFNRLRKEQTEEMRLRTAHAIT